MPEKHSRLTAPSGWNSAQIQELNALVERTNTSEPDPYDLAQLRELIYKTPALWQQMGDLANNTQATIVRYADPQPIVQESIRQSVAALRQALILPTDTALEKIVIEQCITAHLVHYLIEQRYTRVHNHDISDEADFWNDHLDSSQRRYLRALESLARLRRLTLPILQINIAHTQTNIASDHLTTSSAAPPRQVE